MRDLAIVNERTTELEKNKIWESITVEDNTIIVDRLDLSAARDDKAGYLIGDWQTPTIKLIVTCN